MRFSAAFDTSGPIFIGIVTLIGGIIGLRRSAWLQEQVLARRWRKTVMALREALDESTPQLANLTWPVCHRYTFASNQCFRACLANV